MKRRLDDNGSLADTVVSSFPASSLSPARSPSISASSNISIMPTLMMHDKSPNPNVIAVGSSPHTLTISHSLPSIRNKVHAAAVSSNAGQPTPQQFQRLKVEDALSYLDQVKFKFGSQPQVYNDFLDIMKEFKSQSIDTPGVITRVSNLFKGHPELIVGFNTFLPPGYKIEVQSSDSGGYSFQVSVSIPSPSSSTPTLSTQSVLHTTTISHITSGAVTTASNMLNSGAGLVSSSALAIVNPPIAAKPIMLTNSAVTPVGLNPPVSTMSTMTTTPVVSAPAAVIAAVALTTTTAMSTTTTTTSAMMATFTLPAVTSNSLCNNTNVTNVQTICAGNNCSPSPTQSFTTNQAHQAVSQALIQVESGNANQPILQNQPVEFNHAINYVNKIKNRFQGQPDKYKRFLEILHTYQKEQRTLKECQLSGGGGKTLTEAEVYSQVAKLFENQEDLLAEFGQFLPDATSHQTSFMAKNNELTFNSRKPVTTKPGFNNTAVLNNSMNTTAGVCGVVAGVGGDVGIVSGGIVGSVSGGNVGGITGANVVSGNVGSATGSSSTGAGLLKRSSSISNSHSSAAAALQPAVKKHKSPSSLRDVSVTEAGKYGTLNDFAFFDRIRKTIHNTEMYRNFLRCLVIYNNKIINEAELLQLTTPFLIAHPELLRWFKEFLGQADAPLSLMPNSGCNKEEVKSSPMLCSLSSQLQQQQQQQHHLQQQHQQHSFLDQVHNNVVRSENCIDIDYTTCKRIGASYCAVPDDFNSPKCTGRTPLCKEVLNDTWVSFPSWSEDSTFVSSRKTQYEEYIYRCEDERFELDVVIETNAATIRVLDGLQKKLSRLSADEANKYRLDDCLGGNSPSIHQRAIRHIYGDKAGDIIEGLKKNPAAAVPVVLRRLKAKEEEWREAQKGFNKIWREQNEKFYLKSLDHQGMNFKQNDMKYLRSKSLLNEIEALYDERSVPNESEQNAASSSASGGTPHLVLPYKDKSVLDDAANLLIHHVKRQTSIHKEDKQKIKSLIRQFIPDLFSHPRQELSDDEREELEEKSSKKMATSTSEELEKQLPMEKEEEEQQLQQPHLKPELQQLEQEVEQSNSMNMTNSKADMSNIEDIKVPLYAISSYPGEHYTMFFADNHWYLFLRLHQILCDRLSKMYERANEMVKHEGNSKESRKESAAILLRLKPRLEVEVEDYYSAMLDMVKNVLDGNMDSTSYEDTLREMFGIHAYMAFTLDKVVSHTVRQLQYLVTDDRCQDCYDLFLKERTKSGTGGLCVTAYQRVTAENNYQKKVEALNMESCFKIFIYKIDCKITIECLDTEGDNEDGQDNEKWNSFQENGSSANREKVNEYERFHEG